MNLERRVEKLEAKDTGMPRVTVLLIKQDLSGEELERHQKAVAEAERRGEKVFVIELVAARRES